MKKIAVVDLYFPSENEGGQKKIPVSDFSTPIKFEDDPEYEFGAWSMVIELHNKPNYSRETTADMYFLFCDSKEVPNHLLEVGKDFILLNSKTVAKGKIISIKE
ncbi:hypothetical protein [Paenibacillus beijingensis]|uniref:Uncharacterized protein n=1 Tax=Paenibacillus beijingensis TaxID=1126833 RepID=A0A0D5NN61_9BACL|nr:hypothetical protein [Paenibacillus beijingensis]AJY76734.1 hypothetical protein VN24_21895 [Paenibacillus beijingensis]